MAIQTVQLARETLAAFDQYIAAAEARGEETLTERASMDDEGQRSLDTLNGAILVEKWDRNGKNPLALPHGLIHDWIGTAFVPDKTVRQVLTVIQDYDNHKTTYAPEVIDSKLLKRRGDNFQIYLRILKKKIITVVLDTYHDVHYSFAGTTKAWCRSRSTQVLEVNDVGTAKERILPPDTGFGFLWRLYTYWRFESQAEGVFLACRAISLTRDIPLVLRPVIKPIVQSLPKESLQHTLDATRLAVLAQFQ